MEKRVIKIHKNYRSGVKILFLVLTEDYSYYDNDYLEELVINRCDEDPAGSSYGYSFTYEFVTDPNEYNETLTNEIKKIEISMKNLLKKRDFMKGLMVNNLPKPTFPLYEDLYGETVIMDDRFGTELIWDRESALKNEGKWVPIISKKV